MRITIASRQLAFMFPAYMVVDNQLVLQDVSPMLTEREYPPRIGDNLLDHFQLAHRQRDAPTALADIAQHMKYLQLYGVHSDCVLGGTAVMLEDGFLLATNQIPTNISVPEAKPGAKPGSGDLPVHILVSIQKALLEEARKTARDLAAERQRSEDMLARFRRVAGFMAHDFNNLLSVVRLNADLLMQQKGLTQKIIRRIGIMVEAAERGSEITHSLMTLSSQKHDSCPPLAIDQHIHKQRAFFTTSLGATHKIAFNLDSPGAYAEAGLSELTNCLLNLVINARDAMPDGGQVTISTRVIVATLPGRDTASPLPAARHYIEITVTDTGIGMTPDVLARAFEPFFSTKSHGTGVGLASVQEFARNMGGDVSVDSIPGEGTTVHVYLPRCDAPAATVPEFGSALPLPADAGGEPISLPADRDWRILLVDDELHAVLALTELLTEEGFTVTPATDYHQAAAALSDQNFDLLLTDVILPQSNGIALANHACDIQPGLRVIMMSGYVPNTEDMRPDWLFMRKPLDPAKLVVMIRTALAAMSAIPG